MEKECTKCTTISPVNAVTCSMCGSPFDEINNCGTPKLFLVKKLGGIQVEIPESGGMIGRGYNIAPEVFGHTEVSELHCEITFDGSNYFIEDIGTGGFGSTNGTFLNGEKLVPRRKYVLNDTDVLGISEALWFDVKIESPFSGETEEDGDDVVNVNQELFIICPKCQYEHKAKDASDKIVKCEKCRRNDIERASPEPKTVGYG